MDISNRIWPKEDQSFWDIKNKEYVVEINWDKTLFDDYKKLANDYEQCGYLTFNKVIESGHDNIKSDMWFLAGIFLIRQSLELGLKSLICRAYNRKSDVQKILIDCCHNLSKIFLLYDNSNEVHLTNEENEWLMKYLYSLELVDEKSDIFRFPFSDSFLAQYRDKFLDNVDVANSLLQASFLIKKCINCGIVENDEEFDATLKPEFLMFANHGIGNCHLWQPISDDGFHVKVTGYIEVADFIFYQCNCIELKDRLYPLIFILRNTIELCLKRLFYARVDNGVSKHIFFSKRKSHLLKKDLWNNVKPMLLHYATESCEDLEVIDIVEKEIIELDALDKKGDNFRYPTSYSLEYRINNIKIDIRNVFEYMRAIINFLDGCDSMLDTIADYESEMHSYYDSY